MTPDIWFVYDETSPSFLRHKISRGPVKAGEVAGWQRDDGYWLVGVLSENVLAHRVVYELMVGPIPKGYEVDHKDGEPSNCHWKNLRALPKVKNQRNMKQNAKNTSGVNGVSLLEVKGRGGKPYLYWSAQWMDENGKQCAKRFSVSRYGDEEAKRLATVTRQTEINRLNALGLGYTERHGT